MNKKSKKILFSNAEEVYNAINYEDFSAGEIDWSSVIYAGVKGEKFAEPITFYMSLIAILSRITSLEERLVALSYMYLYAQVRS